MSAAGSAGAAADLPVVYFVEDDQNIRELTGYALEQAGFRVEGFADAQGFLARCDKQPPTLVLLDIMLPGVDGLALLRSLRQRAATAKLPIMMVTAKDSELDVVTGLESGADDYLTKPFSMMELISRVNALLRMAARATEPRPSDRIQNGSLCLDVEQHCVTASGADVQLTAKEFDLLHALMKRPGVVLTRSRLLNMVWGYDFADSSRTVDVHIQTLRRKLGESGNQIETVRGVGYRLKA